LTVALAVQGSSASAEGKLAFLEQLIVRRELAWRFVQHNPHYDSLEGCEPWAKKTLNAHRADPRQHVYTCAELEQAQTHDPAWNAAQNQMVRLGWMHNYMRMYWAKKILEWSPSPEEAFANALYLNDKYQLDGRDPNGYTGVAWSMGGKHDRPWAPERPVYGSIRYMNDAGLKRKFNIDAFIRQYR
jgi:deoxyribodipyrimidine photo-lyase